MLTFHNYSLPPKELEYEGCFKEVIYDINKNKYYPWSLYMLQHRRIPPK